ncbi:extracellular solute-binding protein [Kribbella shirazensis]|uniref:Raffinose/stachyose/melibiose transport system substrate-binding protein n=1 Tax=Kribbella shirazensis TaxID=1105143 RepID=A0A7X5V4Z6_9ACTN|nr:extracellular solute-binding protein [Kribbella shirazensis]NIK54286.1 raffinose/stachyose/melibiose transport system substrate-binding protein [Kribbella shirazensis]
MSRISRFGVAAAVGLLGLATACAPGSNTSAPPSQANPSSVQTDPAKMGDVTLLVWDQEVRGGQDAQMKELNAAFQAKYPNIKLKRVSRSFDDLKTTLRLALSGNEPPDVVQANNGRSDMGEFVKANQLVPLDPYLKAYGWDKRYPQSVRQYSQYTPDGKTFGQGNLYGMPQVGEVVGIFYSKKKLAAAGLQPPATWDEFQSSLATLKSKGDAPLVLGNLEKWPAIHVFGTVQGRTAAPDTIKQLGFGRKGASWKTEENLKAAQTLTDWVGKGYFNDGFNGQDYDPAWQSFAKGKGTYLIAGTWLQADLGKAMGDDVGFMLPPGTSADAKPVATGGTGLPFAITAKSKHPEAAAAYLNFITSADAMGTLSKTGNLPVADTSKQEVSGGLQKDVFTAFGKVVESDGLLPYLDYATPTMPDTIGAALQDLLAGKAKPEQFADRLEKDYGAFAEANG